MDKPGGGYLNPHFFDSFELDSDLSSIDRPEDNEISIAWRNVRLESGGGPCHQKKTILRRLNGHFRYHTLNGLVGASGAGKSTFLNCIAGNRQSDLSAESEIYVSKQESSPVSYFVEQHVHESIIGRMTVGETLRYAYRFKNRGRKGTEPMEEYIEAMTRELKLDPSVLVTHFAKCSGGEQKRIAVLQELMSLAKPTFLCIDEPTTGLDSSSAFEVMSVLKQLTTKYRMSIITSIHLPNTETLNLFDKLYVMAKGGVCIYSGPPRDLMPYLEAKIRLYVRSEQQPIEALLKIACNGTADRNVAQLADLTLVEEYAQVDAELHQLERRPFGLGNSRRLFSLGHLFIQLTRLTKLVFIADFHLMALQGLAFILYFALLSALFDHKMTSESGCLKLDLRNETCGNELESNSLLSEGFYYLAFTILFTGFVQMCTSGIFFSTQVKFFRNEHRNKWYSLGVFYFSSVVVSLAQTTLLAVLVASLSYFLIEQHAIDQYSLNSNRYGHFVFCIWLMLVYMQSCGQLLGALFVDHVEVALVLSQVLYVFMAMMNGFFFITEQTSSALLRELANLVAYKFINKYLLIIFYGNGRCDLQTEFSIMLEENRVEEHLLPEYLFRLFFNIAAVRLFTLLCLYIKFNTFTAFSRLCKAKPRQASTLIPLDLVARPVVVNSLAISATNSMKRRKSALELDFEAFSRNRIILAWRGLSLFASSSIYELDSSSSSQRPMILCNLDGQFRFGTINALMGASGAGKTTLLRVLNGQCKTRVDAQSRFYLSKFTIIETCFITQEISGHLWPGLTAKQTLIYASRLKNNQTPEKIDHEQVALSLLEELRVADTADTLVDQCSGGERKRLALALELTSLQMPNLICIDEPTSGLDSNSSEIVMSCLGRLARKHNLTIIASIHQPNSEILRMFDTLYVLARGGVCVYSGSPRQIRAHLDTVPEISLDIDSLPIEELVKRSCAGRCDPIVHQLATITRRQFEADTDELNSCTQLSPDGIPQNRTRFSFSATVVLLLRYYAYVRGYLWLQWLLFTFIYLSYGYALSLFFEPEIALPSGCINLESDDFNNTCSLTAEKLEENHQLRRNFTYNFFIINLFLCIILFQSSLNFSQELVHFYNEQRNGWYATFSFYLMKSLTEFIPLLLLIPTYVHICDIYEIVRPGIYWSLVAILMLSAITVQGLGHVLCLKTDGHVAKLTTVNISTFLAFCLLSNCFIRLAGLHYIFRFISNFSICRFAFESALLLQYGFDRCGHREIQVFMYLFKLDDSDLLRGVYMLLFNFLFYRLIAISLLIYKSNSPDNRRQRSERILGHLQWMQPSKAIIPGLGSC